MAKRKVNQHPGQVPLEVQNSMAIKRLEERVSLLISDKAPSSCIGGAGATAVAQSIRPTLGLNSAGSPPSRPSISESANRLHDVIDKAHNMLDSLADRLMSVSSAYPKQAGNSAAPAVPSVCAHIDCLEAAETRLKGLLSKLSDIHGALLI